MRLSHAGLICALWWAGATVVATAADATPTGLRVEVASSSADDSADFGKIVRAEVAEHRLRSGKGLVLSAQLVELSAESKQGEATVRCRVSMALRDRDGGIKAILRGGARATGAAKQASSMRRMAMEAAVDKALGRLEEAVGR